MQLSASDFYTLHRPSRCDLRVYLRDKGEQEAPPGPFDEVIRRLGERHEVGHLTSFPTVVDLRDGNLDEREQRTQEEVSKGTPVIYQGVLRASVTFGDVTCEILGVPDFLLNDSGGYVIRDCKISKRINEDDHPEILRQLELYGWLYTKIFGTPPIRVEVFSGPGTVVPVAFDGGMAALQELQKIFTLKQSGSEPYSPVGWTKCNSCGFYERCWPIAEKGKDVALVAGVDQGLAIALQEKGVRTTDQLFANFDENSLAEFKRPWGNKFQKVGKRATGIFTMARALASGQEIFLDPPAIPDYLNYVMFDLEGLPPHLDELEKIYLWGLQVFGERPSKFYAATAGFGADGDRQGWETFLGYAAEIVDQYSDLPFVHWHHYEKTNVKKYVERFGDPDGTACRVRENLLDLLPIAQNSIALPLPSYSLKVVEQYVGFRRRLEEYGGDWAMAKYIEATETKDEAQRAEVMDQILAYNQEDLEATWAVLKWLKSKC